MSTINLNNTTPAAASGKTNVSWQADSSSPRNVSAFVPDMVGDSGSGGTGGGVPAPAAGTAAAGKFLRADGTWAVPPGMGGSGTVTSVGMTVPGFLSVTGSPVTTSGTIAVGLASQSAGVVFAGPASGPSAAPTFRALVQSDLPVMTGDSGAGGQPGAVPAPGAGDAAAGKFLKADGTFAIPSGTGASKYSTSWTSQTSVTVTHGLGTTAVIVQVFDSSGLQVIPESVTVTSTTVVTLTFGASFTGSVVVLG